jgi:hypothetical protein
LVILYKAEFRFFGVLVEICKHTPYFWRHWIKAWVCCMRHFDFLPWQINWFIVGIFHLLVLLKLHKAFFSIFHVLFTMEIEPLATAMPCDPSLLYFSWRLITIRNENSNKKGQNQNKGQRDRKKMFFFSCRFFMIFEFYLSSLYAIYF